MRRPGRVALRQLLGTFDPPCPVAAAPSVGLRYRLLGVVLTALKSLLLGDRRWGHRVHASVSG